VNTLNTRRDFLRGAAAGGALLTMHGPLAAAPKGGPGAVGVCGLGRGMGAASRAAGFCDVDKVRLAQASKANPEGKATTDFRELIDNKDIGTINVFTPPHWHAIISIYALRAGKNVFCEKPLTRTIAEGRAFVEAVKRYGRDFRYGAHTVTPCPEIIRKVVVSGILGAPLTVHIGPGLGMHHGWTGMVNQAPMPVPETLDWDMYCGPSPLKPYHVHRTHMSFRGYWDYDGGHLADMGPHVFNALLNNLGKDDTGPVEIETIGPPAHDDAVGIYDYGRLKWADDTTLIVDVRPGTRNDMFIEGPKGKIRWENWEKRKDAAGLVSDPPAILEELRTLPDVENPSKLQKLSGPVATAIHAHRTNSLAILMNASLRVGRKIAFDPVKEEIVGDDQANEIIHPVLRAPWQI
jgi:predicted dehydrogenase